MKKSIKLTKQNIHLVCFRIKQFLSSHDAVSHYSDWGKYPKQMNKLGIKKFDNNSFIEKSIVGYILKDGYSIRILDDYGICINSSKDTFITIHYGDKIKINTNRIIIKGMSDILNKPYTHYFTPFLDIDKAKNYYQIEEQLSAQYWDIVEQEQQEEEENSIPFL